MSTAEAREAFALFDKKGQGTIPREDVGSLLRALGQNPTQREVADVTADLGNEVDFDRFMVIFNRPGGNKEIGDLEDLLSGFQVFDPNSTGSISLGELRYVMTKLGERLSDDEWDEISKSIEVQKGDQVDYRQFVKTIMSM